MATISDISILPTTMYRIFVKLTFFRKKYNWIYYSICLESRQSFVRVKVGQTFSAVV